MTHPGIWTCPITGFQIPKRTEANQRWRLEILEAAEKSKELQAYLVEMCKQSILVWLNGFCYTFRTRCFDANGEKVDLEPHEQHTQFLTWPVQDQAILDLANCITDKNDVLIDKSRDMGASWICLSTIHWFWQFRPSFMAIETSEKEDTVIDKYTEKGLFFRHKYLLDYQPTWMRPEYKFVNKKIVNKTNGSAISGEATTPNISMGGRPHVVLLDEFKAVDCGEQVLAATADAAGCRMFNSTAKTGSTYSKLRKAASKPDSTIKVITLGYWDHPEKGKGRKWRIDEDGSVTGKANRGYYDTPWVRAELGRRTTMAERSSEIFLDHDTAGMMYFDSVTVSHMEQSATPPKHIGNIVGDARGRVKWHENPKGKWKLWCDLIDGFPPIDTNYVQGWDVSGGVEKSNTVGAVLDRSTGEFVAEYADPYISPHDAADVAKMAGLFFGGQSGCAFLGWENNGIGLGFMHAIRQLNYKYLYFKRDLTTRKGKRSKTYGWTSGGPQKEMLLAEFNRAIMRGEAVIHSAEAISELQDYITNDMGRIVAATRNDISSGAYERHGDRVIAYALCHFLKNEAPKFVKDRPRIIPGSMADLMGHGEVWKRVRKNA